MSLKRSEKKFSNNFFDWHEEIWKELATLKLFVLSFYEFTTNILACALANLTSLIGIIYVEMSESGDNFILDSNFFSTNYFTKKKKSSFVSTNNFHKEKNIFFRKKISLVGKNHRSLRLLFL